MSKAQALDIKNIVILISLLQVVLVVGLTLGGLFR